MHPQELRQLIFDIRAAQAVMTESERLEFWEALNGDYCKRCGSFGIPCSCEPSFDE